MPAIIIPSKLRCTDAEAEEMTVLGRWLITECQTPSAAVTRLARRLFKLEKDASWDDLQDILGELVNGDLSHAQRDAISDIKRAFHR